jgi:hypothetical protein
LFGIVFAFEKNFEFQKKYQDIFNPHLIMPVRAQHGGRNPRSSKIQTAHKYKKRQGFYALPPLFMTYKLLSQNFR